MVSQTNWLIDPIGKFIPILSLKLPYERGRKEHRRVCGANTWRCHRKFGRFCKFIPILSLKKLPYERGRGESEEQIIGGRDVTELFAFFASSFQY